MTKALRDKVVPLNVEGLRADVKLDEKVELLHVEELLGLVEVLEGVDRVLA